MAIPDYCDDRAKKHFIRGFVGKKHGEDGTDYSTSWSSTSGAKPSTYHIVDGNSFYCVYCGRTMFPIQDDIMKHGDYRTTGYRCVCKDACDEVEWREKYNELLEKQEEERHLLRKSCPIPSSEVFMTVVRKRVDKLYKDIEQDWFTGSALKSLDIIKSHPLDHNKE